MDSESTIVYYKISDGFIPPDPPESIQEKKRQRQRKFQHRKARFVQLSRQQEHARARQFAAGSQITNPPPGGSTLGNDQKEAAVSAKGVDPMTGVVSAPSPEEQIQQPGPSKRPLDPSPHDTQEGSKHRKVECQSSSSSSNISGPCPVPNPAAMAFCEPQHSPAYGMAPQNAENSPRKDFLIIIIIILQTLPRLHKRRRRGQRIYRWFKRTSRRMIRITTVGWMLGRTTKTRVLMKSYETS